MKYLILLVGLLVFTGCMKDNKTPRTEEFFSKNIDIAKQVNIKCLKKGVIKEKYERIECSNANNALMKDIKKPNRNDNNYKMGF